MILSFRNSRFLLAIIIVSTVCPSRPRLTSADILYSLDYLTNYASRVLEILYIVCVRFYRTLCGDLDTASLLGLCTIANSMLNGHIAGAGSNVFKSGRIGKWQD